VGRTHRDTRILKLVYQKKGYRSRGYDLSTLPHSAGMFKTRAAPLRCVGADPAPGPGDATGLDKGRIFILHHTWSILPY
jgi:hypothetical protein